MIALGLFAARAVAEQKMLNVYRYLMRRASKAQIDLVKRGRYNLPVMLAVDVLRATGTDGRRVEMQGVRGPAEETADLIRQLLTR